MKIFYIFLSVQSSDDDVLQLFLLEETRERKFDSYARLIQKAFKKHFSRQKLLKQKEEASGISRVIRLAVSY